MRVCNLLGVHLPGKQLPPDKDNPVGYWEPTLVVDAHDFLLADLGRSWNDPRPLPEGWLESSAAQRCRSRILEMLTRECAGFPVWGVKDPRLCRFLPMWMQIVSELGCEPYIIHLFRHPDQVVASLRSRDRYPLNTPYELWLRYVTDAERDSRSYHRAFISYDSLLADWRAVLGDVAQRLGFSWPEQPDAVALQIDTFLSQGGRHRRSKKSEQQELTGVAKTALELYDALCMAAEGDTGSLEEKSASYGRTIDTFGYKGPLNFNDPESVRAIAFYLPQFHPIPENDQWWGKGFTEWLNVALAMPRFAGHYQPHLPADLGFYDLRMAEVRSAQTEMARHYGIYGFCYYYYWFNGKRLLELPFEQVLKSGEPDFPFCLCWANENWTRTWSGGDDDILLAQQHSPEDDIAFIESVIPAFRDRRYIKIHDRPLLIVYRPALLPDIAATVTRWRNACEVAGVGDPYLCMVQSHHMNPRPLGFDAAVEFPPQNYWNAREALSPFPGMLSSYKEALEKFLAQPKPDYMWFRGAMPSWDNSSRRRDHVFQTFLGSDPMYYREWLRGAVRWTREHRSPGERFVFINAWNEWAEGCHLEPDLRYGHAWLEATRAALETP